MLNGAMVAISGYAVVKGTPLDKIYLMLFNVFSFRFHLIYHKY